MFAHEISWGQKLRWLLLEEGDPNINFFHRVVIQLLVIERIISTRRMNFEEEDSYIREISR